MSEFGDLTTLFASEGLANLDWLDVDEKEYQKLDKLPKQNLDAVPELEAQWSHEGKDPSAYFIPNRDEAGYPVDPRVPQAPNTMADLSELHGPLMRTARMALVRSPDLQKWQQVLLSKFPRDIIAQNKTALASVLAERGLLGGLYVAASDYPQCANSSTVARDFVARFAKTAKFVVAKTACGDCTHNASGRCSVFHKKLVTEVPYSDELAAAVEHSQQARGVQASSSEELTPKARIQQALVGKVLPPSGFTGQDNTGVLIPASRLTKRVDIQGQEDQIKAAKARPVVTMVRRELLKGRGAAEVARTLRLAFDVRDLQATRLYWSPLFKEAGLYGTVYSTQDSFDECREGADFLAKHGSKVRGIVAGEKCSTCIFAKTSKCSLYGRTLVAKAEDLYTETTVVAVADELKAAGMAPAVMIANTNHREALQTMHRQASKVQIATPLTSRMGAQQGFYGQASAKQTGELTKREIIKFASRFMNEGLYGSDLQQALQQKFDPRDLLASKIELTKLIAREQGLQGIYFIDPTVYADYGHGCREAQSLHRTRQAVTYAKAGDKCATCVHQSQPGLCSVLKKKLAVEIPFRDRVAQQQSVLTSGLSTEIDYSSLVNNGLSMIQEFELQASSSDITLHSEGGSFKSAIQFGNNAVDQYGNNTLT